MQVTGHDIIQRLKELKAERAMLNDRYPGSLFQFPSDLDAADALLPQAIIGRITDIEERIATLQHAQGRYGRIVGVTFEGRDLDLILAVKLLGGLDRAEKLWRQAAKVTDQESGRRRGLFGDYERKKGDGKEERLQRVVAIEDALRKARDMGRRCSTLRGAIAAGNTKPMEHAEIGLDPKLLRDCE